MTRHHNRRGFSLIEAAIVLAGGGLVIGGIWVVAAKARNTYNLNRDTELILLSIEKTRELFRGSRITHAVTFTSSTSVAMGIVPKSFLKGASIYGYSGYKMDIPAIFYPNAINMIEIDMYKVSKADCIFLVSRLSIHKNLQWVGMFDEGYSNYAEFNSFPVGIKEATVQLSALKNCEEVYLQFNF